MKTIKLVFIFIVVATLCSCNPCRRGPWHEYLLDLSFQDASGNDLLSGIEYDAYLYDPHRGTIKKELMHLSIYYDGIYSLSSVALGEIAVSIHQKSDSIYYIAQDFAFNKCDPYVDKIIFRVRCPYVFGDNYIHEIITYWRPAKNDFFECYRIEYEGKEITEIKNNIGIIILEGR